MTNKRSFKVALSSTARPVSKHNQPDTARDARDKLVREGKKGYKIFVWSTHYGKWLEYQ